MKIAASYRDKFWRHHEIAFARIPTLDVGVRDGVSGLVDAAGMAPDDGTAQRHVAVIDVYGAAGAGIIGVVIREGVVSPIEETVNV